VKKLRAMACTMHNTQVQVYLGWSEEAVASQRRCISPQRGTSAPSNPGNINKVRI
jgi:hypothetical protein